ncbi:5-aminovalerate aminotransferase DavT [Catellatospora methionotrophica]|uniref:5-aminovalerate aminotransferase DavT n=1 Tax=Catellatospora methionotrophica TaxID=121620 RepID=A0A8J3L964_9ACTN|nr:aspartate aminotransferase family protein [Catellatospora methionotrophica]GIG16692.1 5-aminovalerate aminotransferase DavT [Catellatospora methionotrophica]
MTDNARPGTAAGSLAVLARLESPSMAATVVDEIGIAAVRGQGSRIWDEAGREYLDLTAGSGVHALGHGDPGVLAAMHAQLDRFAHGGWQVSSPARADLSEQLAARLPWPDPVLLWCTTGSEAVEAALKTARCATGRRQVLGFLGGYHGKTAGALAVTANSAYRSVATEVPVAGLSLPYPVAPGYLHRDAAQQQGLRFGQEILEHPDFGAADVGGLIVETVQGAGGMNAAAPGLLSELRSFCSARGQLLIVDEIFTGFGRTGAGFGFEHEGVVPDLVVLGKALGGGLPLSLVAGPRALLDAVPPLRQTSTFSANPVACAAGAAVLKRLAADDLAARAAALGERLVAGVAAAAPPHVRLETLGRGLMVGVRIAEAPADDRAAFTRAVLARMRSMGVFALRGGTDGAVVKWTPPLTIAEDEIDQSVGVFAQALAMQSADGRPPR